MERASMFYREAAPSYDLESYILSFWELAVPVDSPDQPAYEIFPDGCSSLFYIRNVDRRISLVGISGLMLETITRPVFAGDTFWGMRLSPAACSALLRVDPAKFLRVQMPISASDLPHLAEGLLDQIAGSATFEDFISICEKRIRDMVSDGCHYDAAVSEAVRSMTAGPGEIRIDRLAASLGLSTRQFQRRFKASSGISPKQFLRTRRIRATAVDLVENRDQNWAARAAELGFADQAHLTHEFVSLTNRSPSSFAETLRDISHGDLIK